MSKQIKLFVDAHCFDTEYQGTQTFVKGLYSALCTNYRNVAVYFGTANPEKFHQSFPSVPPSNILPYQKNKPSFYRLLFDIPSLIRSYQFDYAHFQNIAPANDSNCRYIVTLHDVLYNDYRQDFPFSYRYARNIFFKRSFRQAPIKTTVSHYSLERISYHYKIPPSQITVLPNAPTTILSSPISKAAAVKFIYDKYGIENFILNVSRIEPRKNQALLLNTYMKLGLQDKNISLVFIGKESIKASPFRKQLNVATGKKIYWLEQVPPQDLSAFYTACRLFVYPSKAEGFGIPPLEAAIHEVPVVCASTTAMRDFSFFSPYTFHPANEKEFEEKLYSIIDDPPPHDFITAIAAKIRNQYSWDKSAEKLYQLMQLNAKS